MDSTTKIERKPVYPSSCPQERLADGIVHICSVVIAIVGAALLLLDAFLNLETGIVIACVAYCFFLIFSFVISAVYHLSPWHDSRRFLRRLDHAGIYGLIAGTFTPLLVAIGTDRTYWLLLVIWLMAAAGVIYKLFAKKIEARWSVASYLAMGWTGLLILPEFLTELPTSTLVATLFGGLTYTAGTVIYVNKSILYRNAIWHCFVLVGSIACFIAVWTGIFKL